jgi:hypothetical protein
MLLLDCATPAELPGRAPRGSLQVDVYPNPIIALPVGGNVFDFPFEVSLRELGGSDVAIDQIRVEVRMRGIPIFAQIFDETELTRRGYPSRIPANGNAQFRFSPRRQIPADFVLQHVAATIVMSGMDQTGRRTEATTTVRLRHS